MIETTLNWCLWLPPPIEGTSLHSLRDTMWEGMPAVYKDEQECAGINGPTGAKEVARLGVLSSVSHKKSSTNTLAGKQSAMPSTWRSLFCIYSLLLTGRRLKITGSRRKWIDWFDLWPLGWSCAAASECGMLDLGSAPSIYQISSESTIRKNTRGFLFHDLLLVAVPWVNASILCSRELPLLDFSLYICLVLLGSLIYVQPGFDVIYLPRHPSMSDRVLPMKTALITYNEKKSFFTAHGLHVSGLDFCSPASQLSN